MVSTLDSESSDPSSNLGRTYNFLSLDSNQCIFNLDSNDVNLLILVHSTNAVSSCNHCVLYVYDMGILLTEKSAPDVGLEPTTLGLLELWWLASKSPMLYRLS